MGPKSHLIFFAISGKRPEAKNMENYSVFCTCDKSYKSAPRRALVRKEDGRNRPQASGDAKAGGGEAPGTTNQGGPFLLRKRILYKIQTPDRKQLLQKILEKQILNDTGNDKGKRIKEGKHALAQSAVADISLYTSI